MVLRACLNTKHLKTRHVSPWQRNVSARQEILPSALVMFGTAQFAQLGGNTGFHSKQQGSLVPALEPMKMPLIFYTFMWAEERPCMCNTDVII
mmetsp:Transcript_19260/g.37202  ORF Transcript_19260/g.37202 Transcript_19260/m.37202 type:complete len:93 (-) Transcript_19260:299-577(-)